MANLSSPIEPTIIRLDPEETGRLWVRMKDGQTRAGLDSLESVYKKFNPGYPLEIGFMDKEFAEM